MCSRKIGSGSAGFVYAGTYESHPVAIKRHRMDGSSMDAKALIEFEYEVSLPSRTWHRPLLRTIQSQGGALSHEQDVQLAELESVSGLLRRFPPSTFPARAESRTAARRRHTHKQH